MYMYIQVLYMYDHTNPSMIDSRQLYRLSNLVCNGIRVEKGTHKIHVFYLYNVYTRL